MRRLALMLAWVAFTASAQEPVGYEVVPAGRSSSDPVHGALGPATGRSDHSSREGLGEIVIRKAPDTLPPPHVVPYASAPGVPEVEVGKAAPPSPATGEDAVFEQIRQAQSLTRCRTGAVCAADVSDDAPGLEIELMD
ncbi:MAG: hypothetical protein HWE39_19025 [Oceanospirillaceae bacterium]|nr:hypothetical protein [Oceanospirillaceae bacterium]